MDTLFFCLFRPTKVDFSTHESLFFGHESLFSGHESPISGHESRFSGHESPISDTQNPHFRHTHRRKNGFCHSARFAESPYIVIGEVGGDSATTRRMTSSDVFYFQRATLLHYDNCLTGFLVPKTHDSI
jgi:hypothetical protein